MLDIIKVRGQQALGWIMLFILLLSGDLAKSQEPAPSYRGLAGDTIIVRNRFLGKTYLLDGKPLSLEVMNFFMAGHPGAQSQIRPAIVTDQISLVCYGTGAILTLGGILLNENDTQVSRDFLLYGAIGLGCGLVFQIISNSHQRAAVRFYNADIKSDSRSKAPGQVYFGILKKGIGIGARF